MRLIAPDVTRWFPRIRQAPLVRGRYPRSRLVPSPEIATPLKSSSADWRGRCCSEVQPRRLIAEPSRQKPQEPISRERPDQAATRPEYPCRTSSHSNSTPSTPGSFWRSSHSRCSGFRAPSATSSSDSTTPVSSSNTRISTTKTHSFRASEKSSLDISRAKSRFSCVT